MLVLSIVIVNWNVRDLLDACLASIFASTLDAACCEIIVVDSASTDGSVDLLRHKYPSVILLPQAENIGFTRGSNLGLARASRRLHLSAQSRHRTATRARWLNCSTICKRIQRLASLVRIRSTQMAATSQPAAASLPS